MQDLVYQTDRHSYSWRRLTILILIGQLALACSQTTDVGATPASGGNTVACVYTAHSLTKLVRFERLVGRSFFCAEVYNDAATGWQGWMRPWFTVATGTDSNWVAWKAAAQNRRLVIAPGMIPLDAPDDWRLRGARGEYDVYARELASNLINAGLGDSIIRIGHEGNGSWFKHWIGASETDHRDWIAYWRRIVSSMRSVPEAHFSFEWGVATGTDTTSFASYYPGNDVVDIVGFSAHDFNAMSIGPETDSSTRWDRQYNRYNGPRQIIAFAHHQGKPVSISEWGLIPKTNDPPGIGDDPAYIAGIASIVENNDVVYQAIFVASSKQPDNFADSPASVAAYRRYFG